MASTKASIKKTTKKRSSSKKSKNTSGVHIEFKGLLTFLILHELSLKKLAGEDLAKKIGKRKDTILTPGTIYPALKKLKNGKLVVFEKQGRRKVYSLTKKGENDLELSYMLFSKYFYGLKNKIKRVKKSLVKKSSSKKTKTKKSSSIVSGKYSNNKSSQNKFE